MAKIIDIWCNPPVLGGEGIFSANNPDLVEELAAAPWEHGQVRDLEPEELVAEMDEAGVDMCLVPAWKMGSYRRRKVIIDVPSKAVAGLVDRYPDRFRGLYGINPFDRMVGVRELEEAVRDHGFVGAHLHAYGFGVPIDDRLLYPFYAKCAELGVPVQMQVGHSAELMPSEVGRPVRLDTLALDFPEVTFIGAHTGWPWTEELIALAWKHPNVYLSTSAHAPRYWDPGLVTFIRSRGKRKSIWATDFPVVGHSQGLEEVRELGIKDETLELFLGATAAQVYKL